MLISIDFGITITDILRKDDEGNLTHQMLPSNQKPSEEFILELFKDLNFKKEIRGVAPGQSAVFYRDNMCLGGGVISKAF